MIVTYRFYRPVYRILLPKWLEKSGAVEKLSDNAIIADIGCGQGESSCVLASAFPKSKIVAVDYHKPSIDKAESSPTFFFCLRFFFSTFKLFVFLFLYLEKYREDD